VRKLYPDGMHVTIAAGIAEHLGDSAEVRTATFDQPEHGLSEQVPAETGVLTWWGHVAHTDVADDVVERAKSRVLQGMGLVVLPPVTGQRSSARSWARAATCACARPGSRNLSGP
jgi:trehalose utilization protein